MMAGNPIDPAMDKMSVVPGGDAEEHPAVGSADAGTDSSIVERLERNPESKEARLDRALDESMDASDPPSSTQPVHNQGPPESSGYDPEAEGRRVGSGPGAAKAQGFLGRIMHRLGLG